MSTIAQVKGKIIGYGLLLYVAFNLFLFVATLLTGIEGDTNIQANSLKFVISFIIVAGLMFITARWFYRRLKLESSRDARIVGMWWTVMNLALLLFVTIPNGTTRTVFGTWATYLVFVAVFAGAALGMQRKKTNDQPTDKPANQPMP